MFVRASNVFKLVTEIQLLNVNTGKQVFGGSWNQSQPSMNRYCTAVYKNICSDCPKYPAMHLTVKPQNLV